MHKDDDKTKANNHDPGDEDRRESVSAYCKNCGDPFDCAAEDASIAIIVGHPTPNWRPCPRPSPGIPMVHCGVGGHMYIDKDKERKMKNVEDQIREIHAKAEKDSQRLLETAKKKAELKIKMAEERVAWEEARTTLEARLADENGLLSHPKRWQIWNLANELGTSVDTAYYYDTMAELLK